MILSRCGHLLMVFLPVLVMGCASTFETRVSTFRDESAPIGQGTIEVVPRETEMTDSLEFGHYRKKLEQKLAALGYTPVEDNARYLARLGYRVEEREVPDRGPRTSIGTSIGTFGGRVGIGTGVTLSGGGRTETEHYRVVTITLLENTPAAGSQAASHLMEVRATSAGTCGDSLRVFDQMLDAVFTNFLRPSGSTETVEIRADSDC